MKIIFKITFYIFGFCGLGFFAWAIYFSSHAHFEDPISPYLTFIPAIILILIAGVANDFSKKIK